MALTERDGVRAMPKFRKKPVVIEAMQYTGRNAVAVMEWAGIPEISEDLTGGIEIATLEGTMRADPGDWVIRGVRGELYPCKPDIFAATYEPAE
jgi:hypothetical protein